MEPFFRRAICLTLRRVQLKDFAQANNLEFRICRVPCAEWRLLLSAIWHPKCVFFYALPAPTLCCSFLFSHFISTFTFPRSVESKSKLILLFPQQRQHHDQRNRVCAPATACPASYLVSDPLSYADSSVCLYSCRYDKAFCHFDWRRVENGFKLHCFAVREREGLRLRLGLGWDCRNTQHKCGTEMSAESRHLESVA